ncbi:MAG: hypothetical protein EP335_08300 [Alphaproteobacteria bacterium]|nr:MAG: hypothetical protein EP335_08300 [Alphaproteobacteria bacterium]
MKHSQVLGAMLAAALVMPAMGAMAHAGEAPRLVADASPGLTIAVRDVSLLADQLTQSIDRRDGRNFPETVLKGILPEIVRRADRLANGADAMTTGRLAALGGMISSNAIPQLRDMLGQNQAAIQTGDKDADARAKEADLIRKLIPALEALKDALDRGAR